MLHHHFDRYLGSSHASMYPYTTHSAHRFGVASRTSDDDTLASIVHVISSILPGPLGASYPEVGQLSPRKSRHSIQMATFDPFRPTEAFR